MEREVVGILGPLGVDEKTCHAVAHSLREVESEGSSTSSETSADEENAKLRWSRQVGLTAFLLKFGQGMSGELAFLYYFVHASC
jgi:hypothetical protein